MTSFLYIIINIDVYTYTLGLIDSSDSVTIIIVSVTIMTVVHVVDMWLRACAFDIVSSQQTHNHMETCENDKEYVW